MVYRKDIYTAATFAAVRKKVEPQVSYWYNNYIRDSIYSDVIMTSLLQIELDSWEQQEIVQELRSVNRIREALDVVDIVMGFLSSGGGKADRQLGEYITRALRMKKRFFSEKVRNGSSTNYMHVCTCVKLKIFLILGSRTLHIGPHPLSLGNTLCGTCKAVDTIWPGELV